MFSEESIDLAFAIENVTDHRMTEMPKVLANLVQSTSAGNGLDQRPAFEVSHWTKLGHCRHSLAASASGNGMIDYYRFQHRTANKR
jgi:hypothetical protein